MMQHSDVQERVQVELDTVLGNRATASLDEKSRLPYTCAVILEISRKASLVPVLANVRMIFVFTKTSAVSVLAGASTVSRAVLTAPSIQPHGACATTRAGIDVQRMPKTATASWHT